MKLLAFCSVLLIVACSSAKQGAPATEATVSTQVDGTACPNIYDPLPLNRTDGKGTFLKDISLLPDGTYEYDGSSLFVFMETSKGSAKAHFVETPTSATATSVQEVCGVNSLADSASFSAESIASYIQTKTGKTVVGRQYSVRTVGGHFVMSTKSDPFPGDTNIIALLTKASATAIYEMSPTEYEFRSYVRGTDAGKTEHIEIVTELKFTASAN